MSRTAALVLIGNELLSGKVEDANLAFLAKQLFGMGIVFSRAAVIRDGLHVIASEVRDLSAKHDFVFTSGGVGPTHDDITIDAVAKAFDLPLVLNEELAEMIRGHFGAKTSEGHLRMAHLPDGAVLVREKPKQWPVVRVKNVFMMPGVPEIFRAKFPAVRAVLGGSEAFHSMALYTHSDEGEIAALLERVERDHGVQVGSYPRFDTTEYAVKITFDGPDLDRCRAARDACIAGLPSSSIVKLDPA